MPLTPKTAAHPWLAKVSRAYVIAILTTSLLGVFGQWFVQAFVAHLDHSRVLVHLTARYRSLGLRLIKDAYALDDFNSADATIRLKDVAQEFAEWRDLKAAIVREADAHSLAATLLEGGPLKMFDSSLSGAFREVSQTKPQDVPSSGFQRARRIIQAQERGFILATDAMLQEQVDKNEGNVAYAEHIQISLILLTLLALVVEARFIFLPSVARVSAKVKALESAGFASTQQRNEALQQNATLQEMAAHLEGANQRIETAAKRFEALFQGLPIACFGYDSSGTIFEWNRACETMFALTPEGMLSANLHQLLNCEHASALLREAVAKVFAGEIVENLELVRETDDGKQYLLCSTFPIHGSGDEITGGILSCVDLTAQKNYELQIEDQLLKINDYSTEIEQRRWELEEANARLQALASTDGLTSLQNHRAFFEALARDVRRSARENTALSVVLLDVDHFKKYNDSFGHPAGDAVLKKVAGLILGCARQSDLVARYGGEEFVAILPGTGPEAAVMVADRMRSVLKSAEWPLRGITASFGVATLGGELQTADDLVRAADAAMYASKAAGRDRVTHYRRIQQDHAA
jgi:diguanylate cyclase (GGDEF)-like protein/PAS domain S-box-containing protein